MTAKAASKIATVVGARPQFIKAAAVSAALPGCVSEIVIHTGQHYDPAMSDIFFAALPLPPPKYNLGAGSGTHGVQTGRMLLGLDEVLLAEKPDLVLVYGDTNSTLAGALAAVKLGIPVAHVEAGLRCFRPGVPEEINRVITDRIAKILFAPTPTAQANLFREGLGAAAFWVGDVMADLVSGFKDQIESNADILKQWRIKPGNYLLLTLHRPGTVDHPGRLRLLLEKINKLGQKVLFPVHPRTARSLETLTGSDFNSILPIEPLGYSDMLTAERFAGRIITDSGGVQREAYLLGVPCVTLRDETEWLETVRCGWNTLAGEAGELLADAVNAARPARRPPVFGDGRAARYIVRHLEGSLADKIY